MITCANANQWGNGFHIAPKASLRDGLMDVTIIHPLRWRYAFAMPFQILGYTFDKNPDVETYQVNDLLIKRNDNSPVHIDGEPLFCENDIRVVVHKNSVKVFKNNICRVC